MRQAEISRKTSETDISLCLKLDGTGRFEGTSGIGFLDHMLTLFARHGLFDLTLRCVGDTEVDDHHTVEDVGICLGQALAHAVGDKRGIVRYGSQLLPMDETLVQCAVDLSGRAFLAYDLSIAHARMGTFSGELVEEFFRAFAMQSGLTLHLLTLRPGNAHHMAEAAFKATARALRMALAADPRQPGVPSSKGIL